ncbi:MAG: GTPase ObgE [Candidatus Omnitrophica bacterium]|nr:GTPase ObgE [Candidatus Omnitrophota bacterium]MBU4488013.1 GTPase ObgE [Candidatus Omnitrophota bacterium]MCG2704745.1 GTPase ObgE [Candidatus Omnitrophota bacterium]
MFIDEAWIYVKAGAGGDGCRSFENMRGKRYGRPTGGNGGEGGNIVLVADNNRNTLVEFKYNKHFKASSGKHGGSNNKTGEDGGDQILRVPPGTVIRDKGTTLVLRDLKEAGEKVIIAKGGAGGKGNSVRRDATPGETGEEKELYLELKLVADIGIIGYPNAGKSTLLSKITHARPRIANFPFTTKSPILGVARVGEFSFVIADLPGLIEGAHAGRGLGDRFLRHIERTRILLHLIDMASIDGRDPNDDFVKLNNELTQHSEYLKKKNQIVVANKMDMDEAKKNLKHFKAARGKKIYQISALTGEGLEDLLKTAAKELRKLPRMAEISGY